MNNSTKTHTIKIEGMTCDACVQKVEKALQGLDGIKTQSVSLGSATIECNEHGKCEDACEAIRACGFQASESGERAEGKQSTPGGAGNFRGEKHSENQGANRGDGRGENRESGSGTSKSGQAATAVASKKN